VFGAPVYVLDKHLQEGDSLPKWKTCSWLGVYVGRSLVQAGNIPIINTPTTTQISPQFHIISNDQFTFITWSASNMPDKFYQDLLTKAQWSYKSETDATLEVFYTFDPYWVDPPIFKHKQQKIPAMSPPVDAVSLCSPTLSSHLSIIISHTLKNASYESLENKTAFCKNTKIASIKNLKKKNITHHYVSDTDEEDLNDALNVQAHSSKFDSSASIKFNLVHASICSSRLEADYLYSYQE
jgi:hypothetical protein